MKSNIFMKVFLMLIYWLLLSAFAFAQKKAKALQISGEMVMPVLQDRSGFGLSLGGQYGINKNGRSTFTVGFTKNNLKTVTVLK